MSSAVVTAPARTGGQRPSETAAGPTGELASRVADSRPAEERRRPEAHPGEPDKAAAVDGGKKRSRKPFVLGLLVLLALVAGGGYGAHWWLVGRFLVSTDDAYVGANLAQLSARVAARVTSVPVDANQHVSKGDVLVTLDDGDFRLALDQAKARLATQQAVVSRIGQQITAAEATVKQTRAELTAAEAETTRAEAAFQRTQSLASNQYSSRANLDQARAARDKAVAGVTAARAALASAEASVGVLEAQRVEARRTADELAVGVAKAQRDLEATVVRAPINGVVGNKSVQVGDYVTPGKRLAAVVPLDQVYVDANFKETQLARIRPGAKVDIAVDAAGGETYEGTVESIAPASGSQFSLLPPDNATGNFTKIVQRVPVRIAVPRSAVEAGALRPGLSVVATVDTRPGAGAGGVR